MLKKEGFFKVEQDLQILNVIENIQKDIKDC